MDEKNRELVKVRLEKADEDIDTAGELLTLKRYRAAVNRAYLLRTFQHYYRPSPYPKNRPVMLAIMADDLIELFFSRTNTGFSEL